MPIDVLTTSPYNYLFDSLVKVRISAKNSLGYGTTSTPNTNGARIRTVPKAPSVPYLGAGSNDVQLFVQWDSLTGTDTGNSEILSYNLYGDNGSGTIYVEL